MNKRSTFNLQKEKCYSCENYVAERRIKNGIFAGTSIEYAVEGSCRKNGIKNLEKVQGSSWCRKYIRWFSLQNELSIAAQSKIMNQQTKQMHGVINQQREIESQNERILELQKQQIEQIKYNEWYLSLNTCERKIEDERVLKEKQYQIFLDEERKKQDEIERIKNKEIEIARNKIINEYRKKKIPFVIAEVLVGIFLFFGIIISCYFSELYSYYNELNNIEIQYNESILHFKEKMELYKNYSTYAWIIVTLFMITMIVVAICFYKIKKENNNKLRALEK